MASGYGGEMIGVWIALAALCVAFGVFAFCVVHMFVALRKDIDDIIVWRLREGLGERNEEDFR